ncbi:MAG: THUMP domain-containing protein, partial [Clostridiales bacterium]|nr:THUMP domain-containing protein [Clostridiales bacterium]
MEAMTFVVPCLFGLEGLAAEELRRLNLQGVQAENGRVLFQGDWEAMAMANLWLRTGERVLLRLACCEARSFEELFQGVLKTPLEEFIP